MFSKTYANFTNFTSSFYNNKRKSFVTRRIHIYCNGFFLLVSDLFKFIMFIKQIKFPKSNMTSSRTLKKKTNPPL